MFKTKTLPLIFSLVATLAGVFTCAARAADEPETDPAELAKQYDRLRSQRFYRHASSLYENVYRYTQMDQSQIKPHDEFVRAFYEGRWDEIRQTLDKLPDALADTIFNRMLDDLAGRNVPVFTLDDFLAFADACPSELNSDRIRKLGLILRVAVAKEQEVWLKQALKKGTRHLGGGGAKGLNTGRVLMHANFDDLARQYLPDMLAASEIEDQAIRDEIVNFLGSQEELERFQQTRIADLWEQHAKTLNDAQADNGRKQQAADQLSDLLGKAPITSLEPWIRSLLGKNADAALRLASALGKRAQGKINDADTARRANNLRSQKCILAVAAEGNDLSKAPWNHMAAAMADWWVHEAEHTFEQHPSYRQVSRPRPHVAPGDLLDAAPDGIWAEALSASLRDRIDVCMSKAVLVSDQYEEATNLIVQIAARNPDAGISLAEEYLKAWAHRHDPHIPEAIRRKHSLPGDARIMVTPIMMEKNVASLAAMMDIFRSKKIHPRNGELIVEAFNVCYSHADVYRRTHIEKVFGPINQMDEDIFSRMITMMTEGLSSRWRKMEIQEASGTGRSQQETLDMVRTGYQTAIDMIDERSEKQPDAWSTLTLAGSLQSDWADFEYYQQLVSDNATNRMEAFRDKNSKAEKYFTRGAEVYAKQVPGLNRSQYSIRAYLDWFHSLLGITTNGSLNLSKPLDRRALNRIHEMLRSLPNDAGKAHVDMLARHVNSRLEDTENPLHEELKYKYLAGSLVITKSSPFSFQANDKVNYYDELLDEIRLETRVDGPNTIHRDHQFGIILSVHHTEAMGRMANFGEYLTNEFPRDTRPSSRPQPLVTTYRMIEAQGQRDELDLNIREALGLFFDVEAIVFSPKDVAPRPTERPAWEETVLAYVHAKAKDCSVDKIPRIQMNLKFLDMTGPVTISAESAETMIKVTDKRTPPRPFHRVDLTQTLDTRNLASTEEVLLEVKATACGLVPEIDELLDMDSFGQQLPIARIDPHEGTLVRQVNSWGDTVHVVSEREWTIALDAAKLVKEPHRMDLKLPASKVSDAAVKYQTFVDMDLVDLDEPVATVGEGAVLAKPIVEVAFSEPWVPYALAGGGAVLLLIFIAVVVRVIRGPRQRPLRARDVFHMPQQIDGFVVVQLLRALAGSELVRLSTKQRDEMQEEIKRIQATCFGSNGSGLSNEELRQVAKKWLRIAC